MGSDDPALQPLIVLRVVIRSPDLPTFVSKYSRFIKDDRIFIFTKSSQPPGTRVRFTLELSDGQPLINGEGTVTRIRPDSGDPAKPPGMELRFVPLDEPSRELVGRMLHARERHRPWRRPDASETTDAQTDVRDGTSTSSALPREFDESVPTLQPLEKTGSQEALSDDHPSSRQDESGAVTIAQAPVGERTSPDQPPASKSSAVDKQSGGFSTPTPLPAPIPAAPDEFGSSPPPTRLARPAQSDAITTGQSVFGNGSEAAFDARRPGADVRRGVPHADPGRPAAAAGRAADGNGAGQSVQRDLRRRHRILRRVVARAVDGAPAEGGRGALRQHHDGDAARGAPPLHARAASRAASRSGSSSGCRSAARSSGSGGRCRLRSSSSGCPRRGLRRGRRSPRAPTWRWSAGRERCRNLAAALAVVKPSGVAVKPSGVALKPSGVAARPSGVGEPSGVAAKPSGVAAKPSGVAANPSGEPARVESGELSVVTHPAGATVSVDGEARGKTPLSCRWPSASTRSRSRTTATRR